MGRSQDSARGFRALLGWMVAVGACALLPIVLFNCFGPKLHRSLQPEARHIVLPSGANPPKAIPRHDEDPLKLECGDLAPYGELSTQRPAEGASLDRDHVPSNGALRKRAEMLVFGEPLTSSEVRTMRQSAAFRKLERLVEHAGPTIAIPPEAHRALSQTYGGRNTNQRQTEDARDLSAAARRNMDAIRAGLGNYSAACVAAYDAAAGRGVAMTNADYDRLISDSLSGLTSEELEELQEAFDAL